MMVRAALAMALCALAGSAQQLRLDPSRAFFTTAADYPSRVAVATTTAGPITKGAYLRYLTMLPAGRADAGAVDDLGFDFLLAQRCAARNVAVSAPALARSIAARRLLDSGRTAAAGDARLRARFATEALRDLRINALVGAARQVDPVALQSLFDHRYGDGGVRAHVRHVLLRGGDAGQRIAALRARLDAGADFAALLPESQDRTTRRLLRDPKTAAAAGLLPNYNYTRYGDAFAAAVRALEVGAVSPPVRSPSGWHLIELVDRTVTEFVDVEAALKKELGGGKATRSEIDALRRALFTDFEFRHAAGLDAIAAAAADWPHYRGNPELHGHAPGSLGSKPELAWKFETGAEVLSSPVIQDGVVYVGSTDNKVYAIDLATGEERWSYDTGDMVEAPPLVLDGRVYIGSSDGCLYALDAASGEFAWKFETQDKILGGANWFRSADGSLRIVVGSYDAFVYCLDTAGNKRWAYETDNYVHGAPAVANAEIVFGGCDAGLHLVSAETGERVARIDLGQGCQVAGSVALADDKAYFGHYGNEFLCVDLDSGEVDWAYRGGRQGFVSSAAIDDEYVVVGSRDKQLHCMLRADGTPKWTFKTRRKVDASPVICGDKVCFGSGDGRIYLLRLADGEELWSHDIGKAIYSSPAIANGMIVVGAGDNRVYAFRANPGKGK